MGSTSQSCGFLWFALQADDSTGFDLPQLNRTHPQKSSMPNKKDYPLKSVAENPAVKWSTHEFYQSAVVLGLDIGIEGIGVWLRKGRKPLFYRTFKVTLPDAAPLESRRQKRTGRRTRQSRKHRDYLLRQWCQKWRLINEKDLQRLFAAPKKGEKSETHKPFDLRLRAITEGKKLGGPQALVICLRHIVRHRGFDYHLTNEGDYPWGDEMTPSKVADWATHSVCSPSFKQEILQMFLTQGWLEKGKNNDNLSDEKRAELEKENRRRVEEKLNAAVAKYLDDPIRTAIEENLREQRHTNLRTPIRGEKNEHPRELVKKHLKAICDKHSDFFGGEEKMKLALAELIGADFGKEGKESRDFDENCIIDYHRKNEEKRRRHAQRKTGKCSFAKKLFNGKQVICDFNYHPDVRRFKLQLFLAERQFVAEREGKVYATVKMRNWLFEEFLEPDIVATRFLWDKNLSKDAERQPRPPTLTKKDFEEKSGLKLLPFGPVAKRTHNGNFFDQLTDLLCQDYAMLKKRANLCGDSAKELFKIATNEAKVFDANTVRKNLSKYYQWRRDMERDFFGVYPQVEFLMGHRNQYNDDGQPLDKTKDGQPQYHGILRRLFAGQLRLELKDELEAATVPHYVVIETVGDVPRNEKERQEYQAEQKRKREYKQGLFAGKQLTDKQRKQIILFEQQKGLCPYTGRKLNNALGDDLQIDHIFPKTKGGISELRNLVLTHNTTNHGKGERLPFEAANAPDNPFRDESGRTRTWKEIVADLPKMEGWRRGGQEGVLEKRDIFLREDSSEVPDWGNTTRVAQLARQLREEVIRWLGIRRQFDHVADPIVRDNQIANKIVEKIGTPTGFMTACCRDSWLDQDNLPRGFKLVEVEEDGKRKKRIVKDRDDMRHHMIDAAIISHIPPGKGMNYVPTGIFRLKPNSKEGDISMEALPGLGPEFASFEAAHKHECLVSESRRTKSKAKRFEETIYGLPDKDGNMTARVELSKLVARLMKKTKDASPEKIFEIFKNAGLTGKIRLGKVCKKEGKPDKTEKEGFSFETVKEWWEKCQKEYFTVEEVTEFLRKKEISKETLPDAVIKDWKWSRKNSKQRVTMESLRWFLSSKIKSWLGEFKKQAMTLPQLKEFLRTKELNGEPLTDEAVEKWWGGKPERKIGAKDLSKLFRSTDVSLCPLPDERLLELFDGAMPADNKLFLPDGTPVESIPELANNEAVTTLMPHYNREKQIIGYKQARESYVRCEIWSVERRNENGEGIKDGNGKPVLNYYKRLIPHPRGVAALNKRFLKSGRRLNWHLNLTDDELKELGLSGIATAIRSEREADDADVSSAKLKDYEKRLKVFNKAAKTVKGQDNLFAAEKPPEPPLQPPRREHKLSLRKIISGELPPNATYIGSLSRGDLLRVPIKRLTESTKGHGEMCARGEAINDDWHHWYRVTVIGGNTLNRNGRIQNGQIKLELAERKKPSDKELKAKKEWHHRIFRKQPSEPDFLAYLLELNAGHDQPPDPAK